MRWLKSFISPNKGADVQSTVRKLFEKSSGTEVYTLPQIASLLQLTTVDPLVTALAELTKEHVIDQVFRVESPKNRGGIQDFYRLEDVPDEISDWRQGEERIPVTPRMIRILFRRHMSQRYEARNVRSKR